MQSQNVADMTIEELKNLIQQVVNEQLQNKLTQAKDAQSVEQILNAIEQHRWTPPPGTLKASQLILEERDQWRQGT